MKNLTLFIFSFVLISSSTNSDIDKRIDSIMSDMSIEQKIGQMAQINLRPSNNILFTSPVRQNRMPSRRLVSLRPASF